MNTRTSPQTGRDLHYRLEIYPAGEAGPKPRRTLVADKPFIPPRVGELLNPGSLGLPELAHALLRVVNVEHRLVPAEDGWTQTICVYTRKICDNRGVRIFNADA